MTAATPKHTPYSLWMFKRGCAATTTAGMLKILPIAHGPTIGFAYTEEDARLMVAAPALLEALERLEDETSCSDDESISPGALAQARAALKLARGTP